jgi:hypothetical protein
MATSYRLVKVGSYFTPATQAAAEALNAEIQAAAAKCDELDERRSALLRWVFNDFEPVAFASERAALDADTHAWYASQLVIPARKAAVLAMASADADAAKAATMNEITVQQEATAKALAKLGLPPGVKIQFEGADAIKARYRELVREHEDITAPSTGDTEYNGQVGQRYYAWLDRTTIRASVAPAAVSSGFLAK